MNTVSTFLDSLDINGVIVFPNENSVEIFSLWRIEVLAPDKLMFHEKNTHGEWELTGICNCLVQLYVNQGSIEFASTKYASSFNEALDYQDDIFGWCITFEKVVFNKLCDLYDEADIAYRDNEVDECIMGFIAKNLKGYSFERFSCLIGHLHGFFKQKLFNGGSLSVCFPYEPNTIRISSLVNLTMHPKVVSIFSNYLSSHFVVVRLIQISENLIRDIENTTFEKPEQFAKLILSNIDDEARFTDAEISYFLNSDSAILEQLSTESGLFIKWLKFFAEVSTDCSYQNINLLIKKFMLIGYVDCVRNKAYIRAIFEKFKHKAKRGNNYDLEYALTYSLIFNSLDWSQKNDSSVLDLLIQLEDDIEGVRRLNVLRCFIQLKTVNTNYIKHGVNLKDLPAEYVNNLIADCNLLIGMGVKNLNECNLVFVVQEISGQYVLTGSEINNGQQDSERSFYHIVLSNDEDDIGIGTSKIMRKYFDEIVTAS